MPTLTREDLQRRLKGATAAQLDPLYLLHGAEDFLRDRAAAAITEVALKGAGIREFNDAGFDLTQTDVQQALGFAEQLPMMAERRIVRLTHFSKLREEQDDALMRYIAKPSATTTVIFLADELDKRKRLSKSLLDSCTSIEFATLGDTELRAWARSFLKRDLTAEADERVLGHIIALTGSSVRRVGNELSKLATAALPGTQITMESVESLVGRSREHTNFELSDHMLAGNRESALHTLRLLFEDGAEPLMLLGLIASQYRRLSLAKSLMAGGAPNEQVARTLGLHYNKREDFLGTARRTDQRELTHAIARLAAADLAIKSSLGGGGASGARLQIEFLVCELTANSLPAGSVR